MTNGDYVFIMSTLDKTGLKVNGQLDTSWILSPANEKFVSNSLIGILMTTASSVGILYSFPNFYRVSLFKCTWQRLCCCWALSWATRMSPLLICGGTHSKSIAEISISHGPEIWQVNRLILGARTQKMKSPLDKYNLNFQLHFLTSLPPTVSDISLCCIRRTSCLRAGTEYRSITLISSGSLL